MATLTELVTLFSDSALRNRVTAAAIIKAQATLANVAAPAGRKAWAETCLASTGNTVDLLFKYIIAQNATAELSAITGASDANVQTAVNAAIDAVYPAEGV